MSTRSDPDIPVGENCVTDEDDDLELEWQPPVVDERILRRVVAAAGREILKSHTFSNLAECSGRPVSVWANEADKRSASGWILKVACDQHGNSQTHAAAYKVLEALNAMVQARHEMLSIEAIEATLGPRAVVRILIDIFAKA